MSDTDSGRLDGPIAAMRSEDLVMLSDLEFGSYRAALAKTELLKRAKRAELFAKQLNRIQEIGADADSLGLFEAYQQMNEVAREIPSPRAASMEAI